MALRSNRRTVAVKLHRDRKGATFDAVLPQVDSAAVGSVQVGVVTPGNHPGNYLVGGCRAIAAFARKARDSLSRRACARKTNRRGASRAHHVNANHAASEDRLARSTASPQGICQTTSDGGSLDRMSAA